MGAFISRVFDILSTKKAVKILMLGLDDAGKTTILHQLKFNEVASSMPTIGFNVDTVEYNNISLTLWDIGGQDKIRQLWSHYLENTHSLIFVIDSNDHARIPEARDELIWLFGQSSLRDAVVLIFVNKQDLPNALSVEEVKRRLDLNETGRYVYYQPTCATTGNGIYDGMDTLCAKLNQIL